MGKPIIDFTKVSEDARAVAEPIPVPNLKTTPPPETPGNRARGVGRPPKGSGFHYTRLALESGVWQAMKYRKLMGDEAFTTQINNALKTYLGVK